MTCVKPAIVVYNVWAAVSAVPRTVWAVGGRRKSSIRKRFLAARCAPAWYALATQRETKTVLAFSPFRHRVADPPTTHAARDTAVELLRLRAHKEGGVVELEVGIPMSGPIRACVLSVEIYKEARWHYVGRNQKQ